MEDSFFSGRSDHPFFPKDMTHEEGQILDWAILELYHKVAQTNEPIDLVVFGLVFHLGLPQTEVARMLFNDRNPVLKSVKRIRKVLEPDVRLKRSTPTSDLF